MTLNVDLNKLLVESDELSVRMSTALKELQAKQDVLDVCQQEWDEAYDNFISMQDSIEPPGGGRWNDAKRLAYVKQDNHQGWDALQSAKKMLTEASLKVKQLSEQVSNLNRKIRILEIAVTNDFNDSTLLKLGVTRQ